MTVQPTSFPDWALSTPVQGSLNEQQTITFTGVPVSGQFVLGVGQVNTPPILYNDSNATIASKINQAYAGAQATIVSGTIAGGSLVVDFGVLSQTNFIPVMVPTAITMLTSGGAAVIVQANVTQATQLPATVTIDSGHLNNGWMFLEKPAFNIFNQWMSSVGLWIRYLWALVVAGSGKGENLIRNGGMLVSQRGASGTITANTPAYATDGFIVDSVGANTAWSQIYSGQNGMVLKLVPAGTLTDLYVKQRIESVQMESVGYTNITIQALITNNSGGPITPTLALNVPTAADNYGSVTSVLAATNLQTIANGTSAVVAYTFALSNAFHYEYGLEVIIDFGSQVPSGNYVEITNFDVSATPNVASTGLNNSPPSYKARNYQAELSFCQRYLCAFGGASAQQFTGFNTTTPQSYVSVQWPVTMRAIPTLLSATGTFKVWDNGSSSYVTITSVNIASGFPSVSGALIVGNSGSLTANGSVFMWFDTGTLLITAEL